MGELIVLAVIVLTVVGAALWLRHEIRKQVARLVASGCPLADLAGRLTEIDLRLEAQDEKTTEALRMADTAQRTARNVAQATDRDARIATAKPVKQTISGIEL